MTRKKKLPQRQVRTAPQRGKVILIEEGENQLQGEGGMHIAQRARIVLGDEHPSRWQGDRIEPVLRELFPNGVPSREVLANANLVQMVMTRIERERGKSSPEQRLPLPSSDSILRAAGRKKRNV